MGLSGALVSIDLENDQLIMQGTANESPGCVLRGVLNVNLKQSTKIKSIILRFTGTIHISWTQPLGHGHERFFQDERTIVSHQWVFLAPQYTKTYTLPAGNHSYEFELPLAGNLQESVKVAQYYMVQYQLKATIQRPHVLPNYACQRFVHLTRQRHSTITEPISVANQWTNKVDYGISLPSKTYHHGERIPVSICIRPLMDGLFVRQLTCTFKEYATCKPVNGWFGGRSRSHGKILFYTRTNGADSTRCSQNLGDDSDDRWKMDLAIPVPDTLDEIQCDAHSEHVRVRHKLKFVICIENPDGHLSELRAVLPVVIQARTAGLLPSYEQSYDGQSFPYTPTLMVELLRRHQQTQQEQQRRDSHQVETAAYHISAFSASSSSDHHRLSCSIDHDIQQQRGTMNMTDPRRWVLPHVTSAFQPRLVTPYMTFSDNERRLSTLPSYDEISCH